MRKSKLNRVLNGFTLMEMIIVIALIAIVAGVSSDIILSLVRSHTKTQVVNDIEQVGNFAALKVSNELKRATSVEEEGISSQITFRTTDTYVRYKVEGGSLNRYESTTLLGLNSASSQKIIDSQDVNQAKINNNDNFSILTSAPSYTISYKFVLGPSDTSVSGILDSSITIEDTLVLRGTYTQ